MLVARLTRSRTAPYCSANELCIASWTNSSKTFGALPQEEKAERAAAEREKRKQLKAKAKERLRGEKERAAAEKEARERQEKDAAERAASATKLRDEEERCAASGANIP